MRDDGVYFHTHLSENLDEIDAGANRITVSAHYLDTYDGRCAGGGVSLLGRRSVFAHAVHCTGPVNWHGWPRPAAR